MGRGKRRREGGEEKGEVKLKERREKGGGRVRKMERK